MLTAYDYYFVQNAGMSTLVRAIFFLRTTCGIMRMQPGQHTAVVRNMCPHSLVYIQYDIAYWRRQTKKENWKTSLEMLMSSTKKKGGGGRRRKQSHICEPRTLTILTRKVINYYNNWQRFVLLDAMCYLPRSFVHVFYIIFIVYFADL